MLATIDRNKRREYRQKILGNLSENVRQTDELDRLAAEARNYLHLHDRFFFRHGTSLSEDESYGTQDELAELYLDTCRILSRLARARTHMESACTLVHFSDYATNPVFAAYATAEEENR